MGGQVVLEPELLGRPCAARNDAARVVFGRGGVGVERDEVPGADIEAVVAARRIEAPGSRILGLLPPASDLKK